MKNQNWLLIINLISLACIIAGGAGLAGSQASDVSPGSVVFVSGSRG